MNVTRQLTIIEAPHVSEKSSRSPDGYRQYVFKVLPDATKAEIKQAVESLFKVSVKSITTLNVKGKTTRVGRRLGKKKDWKKAYITLPADQEIEIAGIEN